MRASFGVQIDVQSGLFHATFVIASRCLLQQNSWSFAEFPWHLDRIEPQETVTREDGVPFGDAGHLVNLHKVPKVAFGRLPYQIRNEIYSIFPLSNPLAATLMPFQTLDVLSKPYCSHFSVARFCMNDLKVSLTLLGNK